VKGKSVYAVRMQGLELTRGIEGGEEIWYLSYVRGLQF